MVLSFENSLETERRGETFRKRLDVLFFISSFLFLSGRVDFEMRLWRITTLYIMV